MSFQKLIGISRVLKKVIEIFYSFQECLGIYQNFRNFLQPANRVSAPDKIGLSFTGIRLFS
jgi:hypothetical protein